MAATVSPWSKPGAWALDAEEHDAAELLKQQNDKKTESAVSDFPTLSAAAATKTSKKKKKGQTVTLSEFAAYGGPKPESDSTGLTPEDLMSLPKGPRERTEEEIARAGRGGGLGFRSFDRPGRGGEESRWGGSGRERPAGRDAPVRDLGPSRADEVDNWASSKKSSFSGGGSGGGGRDRGGFFDSQSKADESDNWVSNKSYAPPPAPSDGRRFDRERRGFGSSNGSSDSDFWGKKREESFGGSDSGASAGSGAGRPKLNLQPRTLPVETVAPVVAAPVVAVKAKAANPFGAARPREEVLAEKGQDWKKIDEQLESVKIKEAERFGKRGFGSGNGRSGFSGERSDAIWRKPEAVNGGGSDGAASDADTNADATSQSAEKNEDEAAEEQN